MCSTVIANTRVTPNPPGSGGRSDEPAFPEQSGEELEKKQRLRRPTQADIGPWEGALQAGSEECGLSPV